MSSNITKDEFSTSIVKESLKILKLRRNSKKLEKILTRIMPYNETSKDAEVFAYSIETELGGSSNELTKLVLDCTRRKSENE